MEQCIAAIATALAPAGISVIRLSGEGAIQVADRLFKTSSSKMLEDLDGYQAAYGHIFDDKEIIDDAVALVFRAPHSYTGEDVVELSCHGGVFITSKILSLCFKHGAHPAQNGEFTKRAFLNGKMTLTQAEAVVDLINAQSLSAMKAANNAKQGVLYKKISAVCEKLTKACGYIQVLMDYPDEDIDSIDKEDIKNKLKKAKSELIELVSKYRFNNMVKTGVKTVIMGKPNVGKSTIMNLLLGSEKSIVTDISGTTRDIVEGNMQIDGVSFLLFDTAGIRETDDIVEQIGVKKAKDKIKHADLILFVMDGSKKPCNEDFLELGNCGDIPIICVLNKSDLGSVDMNSYKDKFYDIINTSNKDLVSIENLKEKMLGIYNLSLFDYTAPMLANERQKLAAENAITELENALNDISDGLTWDVIGLTIESAIEYLLELSGENASDHVLHEIFSSFCVGK